MASGEAGRLTPRQREVVAWVGLWTDTKGYPPTAADLERHHHLVSAAGVENLLRPMLDRGYLVERRGAGGERRFAVGHIPRTANKTLEAELMRLRSVLRMVVAGGLPDEDGGVVVHLGRSDWDVVVAAAGDGS